MSLLTLTRAESILSVSQPSGMWDEGCAITIEDQVKRNHVKKDHVTQAYHTDKTTRY